MGDFNWIKTGTRVIYKAVPLEMWKIGTVKEVKSKGIVLIRDRINTDNRETTFVEYRFIVGEATERIIPYPFSWAGVINHLRNQDYLADGANNNF
jgi:hypothetical protein